MKCEQCGTQHDGSYGSGRFCKASCARGFATAAKRTEINVKVSLALQGRSFVSRVPNKADRETAAKRQSETKRQKLLTTDFGLLSPESKKRRVILEQGGKCFLCGLREWLGNPLSLQVDHEDGDSQNDKRENLRGLCPNCHSQTPTYCGKHRGKHRRRGDYEITDERLLAALLATRSIGAALKSLGKSRTRDAYLRCKALLERRNAVLIDEAAECGFCHKSLDRPREDGQIKFCNRSCAGKYRAFVKRSPG